MPEKLINLIFADSSHNERPQSRDLRVRATDSIRTLKTLSLTEQISQLPNTLLELLAQTIKPLFSQSQHKDLTSTGRKNLVNNSLPEAASHFSSTILFDDDVESRPLWKNGWSGNLLVYIAQSYDQLPGENVRKKTLEAHFHFLVPPILHEIDDADIAYKVNGSRCLMLLCDTLASVQSGILKRSGLTDVFIEALRNDFSILPTLTEERESLKLYQALYPAWRSLVKARFATPPETKAEINNAGKTEEEDQRQRYLTILLRHSLLQSLNHLSTGTGLGSTISVPLSTFFISQIPWIFEDMGLPSVVHLQQILPLLRNVISDPFTTAEPEMLRQSVTAMQKVVAICWLRIKEKWWPECLRGVVACWVNVMDDLGDIKDEKRRDELLGIKTELKTLVCLLEDVVRDGNFSKAVDDLTKEEPLLEELFNGVF